MSIIAESPGFIQFLSDGSVKRFLLPVTPASPEFTDSFKSKDIVINATTPVTARIFLPEDQKPGHRLPVVVYYHGGGFCFGSTTWSGFHTFLGGLCVKSQAIIVSVDYRLAPEHRLPAAYDDCYSSVQWLASNASLEPWLETADLSRVFLAGESAGANIVHNVMIRLAQNDVSGVDIKGLMIIHPYFSSEARVQAELADEAKEATKISDLLWQLSLPEGSSRDHPFSNFARGELLDEAWRRFPAVKVFVAGLDLLKERGLLYAEFLKGKGLDVEVVMAEDQIHAFHLFHPNTEATHLLQSQLSDLIEKHQ